MDWFPLFNSIRIAALSTVVVFFPALLAAHWMTRSPSSPFKSVWDTLLTLPLVLPPPVIGWLILQVLGPGHLFGYWTRQLFNVRLVMSWPSAALAASLVSFPLLYRSARLASARFDPNLSDVARTLGRSEAWIFWNIQARVCWRGLTTGAAFAFLRALGEYGATFLVAGYMPGRTATVSTAFYHFWSGGDNVGALIWALLSIALSGACLLGVSVMEDSGKEGETP